MKKFKQKTNSSAKKIQNYRIWKNYEAKNRNASFIISPKRRKKICKRGDFEVSSSDKEKLKILIPGL